MTYEQFIREYVANKIDEHTSLRALAQERGIDPGVLSRVRAGDL